jgi:hypothetical protein
LSADKIGLAKEQEKTAQRRYELEMKRIELMMSSSNNKTASSNDDDLTAQKRKASELDELSSKKMKHRDENNISINNSNGNDEKAIWVVNVPESLQQRGVPQHGRVPLHRLHGFNLEGLTVALQRPLKTMSADDQVNIGTNFIVKRLTNEHSTPAFKGSFLFESSGAALEGERKKKKTVQLLAFVMDDDDSSSSDDDEVMEVDE